MLNNIKIFIYKSYIMPTVYKKKSTTINHIKENEFSLLVNDYNKYTNYFNSIFKEINNKDYIKVLSFNKKDDVSVIKFKAPDVIPLKQLLKSKQNQLGYKQSETLFINLSNQMLNLEKDNHTNLLFNINDIVVINSIHAVPVFLYLNTEFFSPITDNSIEIVLPFMKNNLFLSPELMKVKTIPSSLHFKSSYYSIGLLISFCINNENFEKKDAEQILEVILNTKLYFAIKRCLEIKPTDRFLLFI